MSEKQKDNRKSIYVLTCFAKLELDDRGYLHTSGQRTFGYFTRLKDAINAMHTNYLDMWERCYDYGLIETMKEGVHSDCTKERWFKYDQERNGFFEIDKPEAVRQSCLCNFAFG